MSEMQIPGQGEWKKGREGAEFHPDPNKMIDPAEKLLNLDPNEAFDELVAQLPPNTDKEVIRQMKLILNKVIKKSPH